MIYMFDLFCLDLDDQVEFSLQVHSSYEPYDSLLSDPTIIGEWEKFLSGEDSFYSAREWTIFFYYLSQFVTPIDKLTLTFIDYEYGDYVCSFTESQARIKLFLNSIKPSYPDITDQVRPRKRIPDTKTGYRQYSASYAPKPQLFPEREGEIVQPFILLDSGAFTDTNKEKRLSFDKALSRMLDWEGKATRIWGFDVISDYFATYDCLPLGIYKEDCDRISAEAAEYFDSQRHRLGNRQIIFTAQGETVEKQIQCAKEILPFIGEKDVLGIGGFANLGKCKSRLSDFQSLVDHLIPLCLENNIFNIHIWGVRWKKAIEYVFQKTKHTKLNVSCDTSAHYQVWTRAKDKNSLLKGGAKSTSFPEHCAIIQTELASLSDSSK